MISTPQGDEDHGAITRKGYLINCELCKGAGTARNIHLNFSGKFGTNEPSVQEGIVCGYVIK